VNDVPNKVVHTLINFGINGRVVGRALPGAAQWDVMGINGHRCAAMDQL